MSDSLDKRPARELETALEIAQHTVYKSYLNELKSYEIVLPSDALLDENQDYVRMFQLTQLTCKKGEDIFQKLSTVYHAAMSLGCSLFVMVDVAGAGEPAKIYLGLRNPNTDVTNKKTLRTSALTLEKGLKSNFPGTQIAPISASRRLLD